MNSVFDWAALRARDSARSGRSLPCCTSARASPVSELAATATPAILVPLTRVGQEWNARSLADHGAARIVEEGDVVSLPEAVATLLANEAGLAGMARAAAAQARPAAAATIADRLIEAARG